MRHARWWKALVSLAVLTHVAACSAATPQTAAGGSTVLDIPRLDGIAIDGEAADWADRGLKIEAFTPESGFLPPAAQYDVRARLGWDERGLLVLVDVTDDDWCEGENGFWRHDSIGVFVAVPDQGLCEFTISPGMDEQYPELRMETGDWRSDSVAKRQGKLAVEVRRSRQTSRCVLEARIAWSNFDPGPTAGDPIGVLIVATDATAHGGRRPFRWSSAPEPDWRQGQGLHLAEAASPPVNRVVAVWRFDRQETCQVQVFAVGELAGRAVQLRAGGRVLAKDTLVAEGGRSVAMPSFPAPPLGQGKILENLAVQVDGEQVQTLQLPNMDAERMRGLMKAKLAFAADHFDGPTFPAPKFDDPALVEQLAGAYHIETAYYDAQAKRVTAAEKPGVYVGVATVITDGGPRFRRFRALVRSGPDFQPPQRDRMWWNDFKRRYYGLDKRFTRRLEGPRTIDGPPAPQLRPGTAKEADLNQAALQTADAVCQRWAADTKVPFGVLIARHGVIAMHAAYGRQSDGEPMTVDDASRVASITKLLAGELTMMAVDQGLIGLDDPVEKYLPAFAEHHGPKTVTLRHLFTHVTDIPWAGEGADFEESAPLYVPYAHVGERFEYNAVGPSLARRVMETVMDEDLGALYQRCLFGPLGCKNTTASDMNGNARTTPLDLAICGQMLLNRGAYGPLRFFSEEAFVKMLPPDVEEEGMASRRGIGLRWYSIDGLGKRILGHNSASESVLRVDLDHDLIVVVTRSTPGANLVKYQREFFNAVAEAVKPQP